MNNKVENPKVEVPCTINMNDRDYTDNILEELKNMSNNYSVALNEMSCDGLYEEFFEQFEQFFTVKMRIVRQKKHILLLTCIQYSYIIQLQHNKQCGRIIRTFKILITGGIIK